MLPAPDQMETMPRDTHALRTVEPLNLDDIGLSPCDIERVPA